jgi:hypothetical protein
VIGIGRFADQRFANTREEAEEIIQEFVGDKVDAYFACAKFGEADDRTHNNAKYFRSVWIDIDCGPTKGVPNAKGIIEGYLDQHIGLAEFKKFCKAVGLPQPILVNSGNGIHAYWLLEETLPRKEWEPLAKRLKQLCKEHGLIVDERVFEASRVLRPMNSFNFKNPSNPKPVEIWNENSARIPAEEMRKLLGAPEPQPEEEKPDFVPASMSPMMEALMANKVKKFKNIMLKAENGCAQLNYCFENQAEVDEPLWMSALSIPAFCTDGDKAAHKMSDQHPEYDPAEVDNKLKNIRKRGGPHHCTTFEERNPGGCDGCPHKGKITSPIVLGIEIEAAEEADNEVVVETEAGETKYQIPEYPFPFFRGKNGGIYQRAKDKDDNDTEEIVYPYDFYVVKRMQDPELGDMIWMRVHMPKDGVREFACSNQSLMVIDRFKDTVAPHGVIGNAEEMKQIMNYITNYNMKTIIISALIGILFVLTASLTLEKLYLMLALEFIGGTCLGIGLILLIDKKKKI